MSDDHRCAHCRTSLEGRPSWGADRGQVHFECHDWSEEPPFPFDPAIERCRAILAGPDRDAVRGDVKGLLAMLEAQRAKGTLTPQLVQKLLEEIDHVTLKLLWNDAHRIRPAGAPA